MKVRFPLSILGTVVKMREGPKNCREKNYNKCDQKSKDIRNFNQYGHEGPDVVWRARTSNRRETKGSQLWLSRKYKV